MPITSERRRAEEGLVRACNRVKGVDARMQVVVRARQVRVTEVGVVGTNQVPSAMRISGTRGHDLG